jgi:hypothetical protein
VRPGNAEIAGEFDPRGAHDKINVATQHAVIQQIKCILRQRENHQPLVNDSLTTGLQSGGCENFGLKCTQFVLISKARTTGEHRQ